MDEYKVKLDTAIEELKNLKNTPCNFTDNHAKMQHYRTINEKKREIKNICFQNSMIKRIIELHNLGIFEV